MKRKSLSKAEKEWLIQNRGTACFNCGSTEEIEWHHVVPLEIGGNHTLTNLVPLCKSCHMAVTHHQLILQTAGRVRRGGGRKRIIPDNYKDILSDYIHCKITKTECTSRLGLSAKNTANDASWFKEYLEEIGVKSFRNNLEIIMKKGGLTQGKPVGNIKYTDGAIEILYYNGEIKESPKPMNDRRRREMEWERYKREHYQIS